MVGWLIRYPLPSSLRQHPAIDFILIWDEWLVGDSSLMVTRMDGPGPDIVFEINRLIVEDTGDMWKVAVGLTALEVVIICHLVHEKNLPYRKLGVAWAMTAAAVANLISISFGFFAKNGLISLMLDYAKAGGKAWTFNETIEWMNGFQLLFMVLGIIIFLVIFFAYSKVLADIIVRVGGKNE